MDCALLVLGLGLGLVLYYRIWILLICVIYPDIRRVYPTNGSHVFQPEPPISTYILTMVMGSIPHSQGIVPFKWSMSVWWDVILYSLISLVCYRSMHPIRLQNIHGGIL